VTDRGDRSLAADRARALALMPVSDETRTKLDAFVALLINWQRRINLVAAATLPQLWTRHIADSLQLLRLAPEARIWVDLGSGGGFPGIPIACALAGRPGAAVHLVESNGKKAAFLREAVRVTGAPAIVHAERIEKFGDSAPAHIDVVTARALAPLKLLYELAMPFLARETVGLFLKGQDIEAELTEAAKYWTVQYGLQASLTGSDSRVVVVRRLERKKQRFEA
jgi:16S rRNA (guanine527-N7)-methyltransferase